MSNQTVPTAAEGMPAPTRRAVLIGGTAKAVLAGAVIGAGATTLDAALAAIPTWMALKIETHRETYRALSLALKAFNIHDEVLVGSPFRASDPGWQAADRAVRLAVERNDLAFRSLLAERPRSLADIELRARYLAEECEDEIDSHPDFLGLFLGSMTGREG